MKDLIERQAAIDAMEQAKEQYFDRRLIIGKMQDIVNNLPSAEPERKKGMWIRKDDYCNGIIMRVCKCSACGANAGTGEDGFWYKSNYCPNCGARMEKGEDDE